MAGEVDTFGLVDYSVETITVYKGEDGTEYGEGVTFDFSTQGNSAACGIDLDVGEEYLLDFWLSAEGSLGSAGLCGLTRIRSSITDEDMLFLQDPSLCDIDPCVEEPCGEFQECLPWEGTWQHQDDYYCADVCDPSPCGAHETCELVPTPCASSSPCPDAAVCSDPCNGTCGEFQKCSQFISNGKWYCSDNCSDGACAEGEQCRSRKTKWCRGKGKGCPKRRKCF